MAFPLLSNFTYLSKGVILSTAFVHLLQDAFDRLQDPQVKQYTNIGRWTGLIV
jgi:zinc transporter 1/2/3